jgi:ethanolamine ammonia-lyase large subunit
MNLSTNISNTNYSFSSLKEVMAKANEEKSGDTLAGIAAESAMERIAAKKVLSNLLLSDLREHPVIPYDEDEVTRIIQDEVNQEVYGKIRHWKVSDLREWLLSYEATESKIIELSKGLTSEMIAAVCKLMSNLDLVYCASKIRIPTECNTTIGLRGTISTRLQPNHTTDNLDGITASVYEGLSYGCGDALIGLNPVNDSVESLGSVLGRLSDIKNRLEIPTQICVLGHITTQLDAVRKGAPTDLIFQSIAGSQKGNEAFGFSTEHVLEASELLKSRGTARGSNVMYFETGQGSELSSEANYGADQVTMEARCYGYAKKFNPFLVKTVVGFIGPEYLYDSKQLIRAGLEDHFMGKLSGVPMGCDCCYTNHMLADQNDVEDLTILLSSAGVNYVVTVPSSDDIMLNYQSNAYHDAAAVREVLNLRPNREFEVWLEKMGIMKDGKLTEIAGDPTIFTR